MQRIFSAGRYGLALAVMAFGLIQFASGHLLGALFPLPADFPGKQFLWGLLSTLFTGAGIGMLAGKTARRFALLAAFLFFAILLYPNGALLLTNLHNGGVWTVVAELAALGAGALILAGKTGAPNPNPEKAARPLYSYGRILFALSLLVFGILHFQYADYIATLITAWIPFKLFWSYFVGLAFIAGAISILTNTKILLASTLLGFMFLFWVIFEHLPRVVGKPKAEPEWTSLFIALAFCGIFFMLAEATRREKQGGPLP